MSKNYEMTENECYASHADVMENHVRDEAGKKEKKDRREFWCTIIIAVGIVVIFLNLLLTLGLCSALFYTQNKLESTLQQQVSGTYSQPAVATVQQQVSGTFTTTCNYSATTSARYIHSQLQLQCSNKCQVHTQPAAATVQQQVSGTYTASCSYSAATSVRYIHSQLQLQCSNKCQVHTQPAAATVQQQVSGTYTASCSYSAATSVRYVLTTGCSYSAAISVRYNRL